MKTDSKLGEKINLALLELGLETPTSNRSRYSKQEQIDIIEKSHKTIMQVLGLDMQNDSLKETPIRVAKMYVNEVFEGLDYDTFPKCTKVENEFRADEMVIEGGIDVSSTCEHHFQNIEGQAKIAYIPGDQVLGLSKLNRIVRFFSKRPQIQERLVLQIQTALCIILETPDVAVEIRAVHHCVKARGIEDKNCWTTTRKLGGVFKTDHQVRTEFLNSN
jgi:GTP cyclohydrolase I